MDTANDVSTDSHLAALVWDRLSSDHEPMSRGRDRFWLARLEKQEYLPCYAVGDLLVDLDSRLHNIGISDLRSEKLEITPQTVFPRPGKRGAMAMGGEGLSRVDVVALLIWFESVGFALDPEPFVRLVLPQVEKQTWVNKSDLRVLWYKRERHRLEVFWVGPGCPGRAHAGLTTSTGYKVEAWLEPGDGAVPRAKAIRVKAPRSRRVRMPF
ncbi:MAG: hypothetical protein IT477_10405 [Rhodanobacteraceae bacterium]|nr:hypothetical protein [Rhodanobacteraceae bacterium]